jgi:hypothetical protein
MTSFILETKKSSEILLPEIEENLCGNGLISFAFSLIASLPAFFQSGRGSNKHSYGRKENTERLGKWSDPRWRSFLTLHGSMAVFKEKEARTRSMVASWPLSDWVLVLCGSKRSRECVV